MARAPFEDPELRDLFGGEPELLETAHRVQAARPEPVLDPRFRAVLRAQLMREAATALQPRRRRFSLRMGHVAWGSGAVGLAAVAALVFTLARPIGPDQVQYPKGASPVAGVRNLSPNDVITVSFTEPMNESAVEAGVHITPATTVTYSWSNGDKTLTMTPAHPLSGNTPYSVTIDHTQAKSAAGASPQADVAFSFGTAPTPAPVPSPMAAPPALTPAALGPVAAGSVTLFTGTGDPATTRALLSPPPTASPAPSTESPAASPSAAPQPAAAFLAFPSSGGPLQIAAAVDAAAFSSGGHQVAFALPRSGVPGDDIIVAGADGGSPVTLTSTETTVTGIAWSDASTVVFAAGGTVRSVDLQHKVTTLDQLTGTVQLAPGGHWAFLLPDQTPAPADGSLVDLGSGAARTLPGSSSGVVAFSADGSSVAWIDRTQADSAHATRRLLLSATASDSTQQVATLNGPGDRIPELALSGDGSLVAYTVVPAGGGSHLVVARSDTGAVTATLDGGAQDMTFSPASDRLALLVADSAGALTLESSTVPGAPAPTAAPAIPAEASHLLSRFVAAQVGRDSATLSQLAQGVDAVADTPPGLSRGYVIGADVEPDGTIAATARLIIDPPAGSATTRLTDETVTLTLGADSAWHVTALTVPPLTSETPGPHVVHVSSSSDGDHMVVTIGFDSDLDGATVTHAVVVKRHGAAIDGAKVTYDGAARQVVVTLPAQSAGVVTVHVSTDVADIDGQHLAAAYSSKLSV
jgi:hypothetical protein